MAQLKPKHKTFTYTLFLSNGNSYTSQYTCGGYTKLLEFISDELDTFNVDNWRIDSVRHNF